MSLLSRSGAICGAFCGASSVVLLACGSGEPGEADTEQARVLGNAEVGGEVVSTVNGYPITNSEITHAAAGASVDPALALARLQDEAVLAQEAERAGWGGDAEVERARRRALVQALLARAVEASEVDVDPEQLEAVYLANGDRFDAPERRSGVRVLARAGNDDEAAQRWIAEVHDEISRASDPVAAALAVRRRQLDVLPFGAQVEEVAPSERAADPYLEALFALEQPGVGPAPVRAAGGWYVVVLTRIEPARTVPRVDALLALRDERVAAVRASALAELLGAIARDRPVVVDPSASSLLANPRMLPSAGGGLEP